METINKIAEIWWNWMGPMLVQITVLIALISLIDFLTQKWVWPQVRYGLWILILVKLLIPPNWSLESGIISHIRLWTDEKIENAQSIDSNLLHGVYFIKNKKPDNEEYSQELIEENKGIVQQTQVVTKSTLSWKAQLLFIYLVGVLVFLSILILKIKKLRRWHDEQVDRKTIPEWFYTILVDTANRLKINHLPAVVFSANATSPAVYGIFNPVLLLPYTYFKTLSKREAEHIVMHELTHIKRGDLYIHALSMGLQVFYWFNPLLIWVQKQMKHVRELCCDATIAVELKEEVHLYRKTLLDKGRELLTQSFEPGLGLLGVFEDPFRIVSRIRWLEKNLWKNRSLILGTAVIVSIIFGVCFLPMGPIKKYSYSTDHNAESAAKIESDLSSSAKPEIRKQNSLELIQSYSDIMNKAIMDRDFDRLFSFYADDVISMPNHQPFIKGKATLRNEICKSMRRDVQVLSSNSDITELWECGNQIIEKGVMNITYDAPELIKPYTVLGKYVTVWEKQKDNTYKVKIAIWNSDISPFDRNWN